LTDPRDRTAPAFVSPEFWIAAAAIWTGAVLALACSPNAKSSWLMQTLGDKVLHAFAFTVGAVLWTRAIAVMGRLRLSSAMAAGAVLALIVGAGIEILQMFVPTRQADIRDFGADAAGVLLSLVYLAIAAMLRPARRISNP
jgi:VanZ family protein